MPTARTTPNKSHAQSIILLGASKEFCWHIFLTWTKIPPIKGALIDDKEMGSNFSHSLHIFCMYLTSTESFFSSVTDDYRNSHTCLYINSYLNAQVFYNHAETITNADRSTIRYADI